jgi:type I restriction enzyme S subunit
MPDSDKGPWKLTAKDIVDGKIWYDTARHTTDDAYKTLLTDKSRPRIGDVLLTKDGSIGRVAVVDRDGVCINQSVALLRPNKLVIPRFLAFLLRSPYYQAKMEGDSDGSTIKHIYITRVDKMEIAVPSISEQEKYLTLLGAIDDRIDLLRQTNATLEAIAQALFKSWFIDFDPVRAKAEGREPEAMDADTAALFPDSFEDSALGEIPKGWRVGDVYDVATVRYGAPFSSKLFNTEGDGLPLVRIRDLKDETPGVWTPEIHPKGYKLQPRDIVVGMDGEFRAYLWGGDEAWMNQRICAFHPKDGHSAAFVRCSIAAPLAHVEATETATTVIHLGKGDIDRFRILVPPQNVALVFGKVTEPLYHRIVAAKQAMRSLQRLRDTLLPRLISGKLRLPEAEAQLNEALA